MAKANLDVEYQKEIQASMSSLVMEHPQSQSEVPNKPLLFSSQEQEIILHTFQTPERKLTFIWRANNQVQVLLEQNNKTVLLSREDIAGIPEVCFSDRCKMKAFLSKCQLNISEYVGGQGFRVNLSLGLAGGGNIGVGINFLPMCLEYAKHPALACVIV